MSKGKVIIALVIGVIGLATWYMMSSGPQMGGQMGGAGSMSPVGVSVYQLKTETINREETLPGRISAFRQAEIRPQVNGIITKRLFEEGAVVEQGQPLYQIDDVPYRAAFASAQADLVSAQANLQATTAREARFKELLKTNAVSGQAYDDVKADLDKAIAAIAVAEAGVEVAQVNLNYTQVYAPISGRIGRSSVTEGALVTTNQSDNLSVITQLDPVFVDISQPGVNSMRLRNDMVGRDDIPVQVILDTVSGVVHPYKGQLKFSDVVVDETTGSVGLRALVPNPDQTLLPGLFVRATIELGEQQAVLVPQRSTTRNPDGGLTVWLIDGINKVTPHQIVVAGAYGDQWIVASGVEAGETIVIEGYQKIRPGMTVIPSPWAPAQ